MKTIKGLRFYTYQEAAHWLECSVPEVEEMVTHRQLLAYKFRNEKEPYVQSRRSYRAGQTPGIRNERYLSHEMAVDRPGSTTLYHPAG